MNYIINSAQYKDKDLPLHQHDYYEVIIYIDGEGIINIDKDRLEIKRGDIVVIPPKTMHGSAPKDGLKSVFIAWKENAPFTFTKPVLLADNENAEGQFLAKAILDNRFKNTEYLSALCNAFAKFILQNVKIETNLDKAISQIVNEITLNFQDCDFNLNNLLNSSGYAEDYIREQFKLSTGKSPVRFLTDIRIDFAEQLIELYSNQISLSEVALRSGYYDYAYFSRRFRQKTGVSPQVYKQQVRKKIEQKN